MYLEGVLAINADTSRDTVLRHAVPDAGLHA